MDVNERNRLIELTTRAVSVNERLLTEEKRLIAAAASAEDLHTLIELIKKLAALCRTEHLYIDAAKSLLTSITSNAAEK
jgi:hypothetical protein